MLGGSGVDVAVEAIAGVRLRLQDLGRRLVVTLGRMSPEDLAWRPNAGGNSAAHLVLHVCGNLRQRFHAGLGGAEDDRDRDGEFSAPGPWTSAGLVAMVESTFAQADAVLAALPSARLGERLAIRGQETTVLEVLLRVPVHVAEHVGQVVYIAKARLGEGFASLSLPRGR